MPREPSKRKSTGTVVKVPMDPDELLRNAVADRAFMTTNEQKSSREVWVLSQWLAVQAQCPNAIVSGEDPPDFRVDGRGVEVVEVLEPGRKRGDEYSAKVDAAKAGNTVVRSPLSLQKVRQDGHMWILDQVQKKAAKPYDAKDSSSWTLLVYANFSWADRVEWNLVEASIINLRPQFLNVDVLYSTAPGHVVRTIFARQEELR